MEERRRSRKLITNLDQEFLNHLRSAFAAHSGRAGRMSGSQMGDLLGIKDRTIAKRVYEIFEGGGRKGIDEAGFRASVISLVLGDDEAKLKFVFDLFDQDGDGAISRGDLAGMVEASLHHNNIRIAQRQRRAMTKLLFEAADRKRDNRVDFGELKRLLARYPLIRNDLVKSVAAWFWKESPSAPRGGRQLVAVFRFAFLVLPYLVYQNILILVYIALNAWLFRSAQSHYAAIGANVYIQIARGAGACLNLNGALILVPMMRTFLTWIRKSFLAVFVPVDHAVDIHRIIGQVMFAFSIIHSAAHLLNYKAMSATVPFRDKLFGTRAGLTGVILISALGLMWLFAQNFIRRRGWFEAFSVTHSLYVLFFAALLVHAPNFWKWGAVPLVAYGFELYLKRNRKREVSFIESAAALPSGVSRLAIRRPEGFAFRPGDYLFLKIPRLSRFEWHPFTISSNPEREESLGLHVRSLGNWTRALYRLVETLPRKDHRLPVEIRGPYGTPSTRIFRSRCAVLVGAGIGVTPFASILGSILYRREHGEELKLEKIYFFWLNRGAGSFEWFTDMLAEIEAAGMSDFIELNIYMTDARIDATSGLVKIGMDLLGKQENRDLTTGLKTITNFGRPDWRGIFSEISRRQKLRGVDVYFCGPYPLAQIVKHEARRCGFRFRKENF
jgi:predicted ferric reductase/Ca2+-binding EF-hand superfamily protein